MNIKPEKPTVARQAAFWISVFFLFVLFVWLLGPVLMPFVFGAIIAYFLNPVCEKITRWGIPRWGAALLVLGVFGVVLILLAFALGPLLIEQVANFIHQVPTYINESKTYLEPKLQSFMRQIPGTKPQDLQQVGGEYTGKILSVGSTILESLWQSGATIINLISLILIMPIVAYYLMKEWQNIIAKIDSWLPQAHAPVIRHELEKIDRTLAGFVRGQATVCFVLGCFYGTALSLVGLNFAIFIGVMAGVISFIPLVGSTTGFVTAIVVALFQFGDFTHVAIVMGIFVFAQFVEGNFLTPTLVGESVGLHPLWIIFALMAGGYLFGFIGLLLAVPVAAVFGVLVRFLLNRYLHSTYYALHRKPKKIRHVYWTMMR